MTMPSLIITQTSSLVSTVIYTSRFIDPRAQFDEDIVVSLGDYYYSKPDKVVIRKGKKRARDQSGMEVYVYKQIVWTQLSHPHPSYRRTGRDEHHIQLDKHPHEHNKRDQC